METTIPNDSRLVKHFSPTIEWIQASTVKHSARSQRPFREEFARKLAAEFDPDAVGFPCVWAKAVRNGEEYYAIDGYHRIQALIMWAGENQLIQCEVLRGCSEQRAAQIFLERNARRNVSTFDKFVPRVTANDPLACAVAAIVKEVGLQVSNQSSETSIRAVAALERVYKRDMSGDILRWVLWTCKESWPASADNYNGDIVNGLGLFYHRHGEQIETSLLRRKLRIVGPLSLLEQGRLIKRGLSVNITEAMCKAVVGIYNKSRVKGQIANA